MLPSPGVRASAAAEFSGVLARRADQVPAVSPRVADWGSVVLRREDQVPAVSPRPAGVSASADPRLRRPAARRPGRGACSGSVPAMD
ncbi:hypothetical protein [Kribbella sp. CWNU-51]